jgi:hypothetical protein
VPQCVEYSAKRFEALHLLGHVTSAALTTWRWSNGLQHLRQLAGTALVEVLSAHFCCLLAGIVNLLKCARAHNLCRKERPAAQTLTSSSICDGLMGRGCR